MRVVQVLQSGTHEQDASQGHIEEAEGFQDLAFQVQEQAAMGDHF